MREVKRQFSMRTQNNIENNKTSLNNPIADEVIDQYSTRSDALEKIPLRISEEIETFSFPVYTAPSMITIPKNEPPAITVTSDEPPAITVLPGEPPVITVTPDEPPAITVTPDEPPAITVTPDEPPAITVIPDEPPAITVIPDEPPVITVTPDEPPTITVTPDEPPSITVMPDEPTVITIMPNAFPTVITVLNERPSSVTPVEPSPRGITFNKHPVRASPMDTLLKILPDSSSAAVKEVNTTESHSVAAIHGSSPEQFEGKTFQVYKPPLFFVAANSESRMSRGNVCSKTSDMKGSWKATLDEDQKRPLVNEIMQRPFDALCNTRIDSASSPIIPVHRPAFQKPLRVPAKYDLVKNKAIVDQKFSKNPSNQRILVGNSTLNGEKLAKQEQCQELLRSTVADDNKRTPSRAFTEDQQELSASSSDSESPETVVRAPVTHLSAGREKENKEILLKENISLLESTKNGIFFEPVKLGCVQKFNEKTNNSTSPLTIDFSDQQSTETGLKKINRDNIASDQLKTARNNKTHAQTQTTGLFDTSADEALRSSTLDWVKPKLPTSPNRRPALLCFSDIIKRTFDAFPAPDSRSNHLGNPDELSNLLSETLKSPGTTNTRNDVKIKKLSPTFKDSTDCKTSHRRAVVQQLVSIDEMCQNGKDEGGKLRLPSSSLDDTDDAYPSEQGGDASLSSNGETDDVFLPNEKVLKRQSHIQDDYKSSSSKEKKKAKTLKDDKQEDSESEVEISDESESEEDLAELAENEASAEDEEVVRLIKHDRTPVKVVKRKSIKFSDNHHVIELDSRLRRNSDSRLAQLISYGSSMKKKSRNLIVGNSSGTGSNESPSPSPEVSTENLIPHKKPNLKKTSSFGLSDNQSLSPMKDTSAKGSVSAQSSPRIKHRERSNSFAMNMLPSHTVSSRPRCNSVDDRSAPGVCLVCNEWVGVHHDPHADGLSNRGSQGDVPPLGENGGLSCGSPYNTVSLPSSPITPHIVVSLDEDAPAGGEDFQNNGQGLSAEDNHRNCQLAKSKSLGSCEDLGGSK
ncbi:hypothetical protein FHG87_011757, partial [Trinorchestia longiramus]